MAIHEQQTQQIEGGFVKKIDEESQELLLDMFQKLQYSYPEKSTVRELVSNAIDATREREMARKILNGDAKIEDYYVDKEGSEYKDSHFDPLYYDTTRLSTDPNIYITYKEGSALEKDTLIIRDNGVGLGGSRLIGYFCLGYSTKRLSGVGLGKFGIGAKAALSTGVPFYLVKNRYNGRETWWNVASHKVQPTVPRFDMKTEQEYPLITIEGKDGTSITTHYIPTSEPNGLQIEVEVKKHHKQKYIDAVKSQLLYFDNIVFTVENFDGRTENIAVTAPILYEDNVMILSKNEYYSKPHILVNRVNYGLIDFQELELEDKMGNISIKLQPNEVSVSPNREKVIWDDLTREAIKRRFQEVQQAAEKLLQGELEHTDFMKWLRACISMRNAIGTEQGSSAVFRLAKLVDISTYAPRYKPDKDFRLDKFLFAGLKVRKIVAKTERYGSSHRMVVDRIPAGLSDLIGDMPILIQQGDTSWVKDRYLLEDMYQEGFITIWLNETSVTEPAETDEESLKAVRYRRDVIHRHALDTAIDLKWYVLEDKETLSTAAGPEVDRLVEKVLDRWNRLNKYILASEGIEFYDTIEIPENYRDRMRGIEEEDGVLKQEEEVKTKEAQQSAEERRKLKGDTILFTPSIHHNRIGVDDDLYTWHKLEIPVIQIDTWNEQEIYYSSDNDAALLKLAAFITRPDNDELRHYRLDPTNPVNAAKATYVGSRLTAFDNSPEVKLIKVAQNRVKYYRDFKQIRSFFFEIKNKTLTMSNKLIKWNTARLIHQSMDQLKFMEGFQRFNEDHYKTYVMLRNYHDLHYREVGKYAGKIKDIGEVEYGDMISHMDSVSDLQIFVANNPDDHEAIAKMVKGLFGTGTEEQINDGCAIDMNIRAQLLKLLDYVEPIHLMLNQMPLLTEWDSTDHISEELEMEIRNYLQYKKAGS
jgi:hypothetical protein